MKLTVVSSRLFFLSLLFWNASGIEPAMTSMCSDNWLIVRMKKIPFDNNTEVRVGDLHLGDNCSVTRALSSNYEFSYPAVSCGINKFVFQENVFILSEIKYRLVSNLTHRFPVVCFVKRPKLSSLEPFGMRYGVSNFRSGIHVIGQQPSVSSQSKACEPNFTSCHKGQLPVNHWINNPCAKTLCVP